ARSRRRSAPATPSSASASRRRAPRLPTASDSWLPSPPAGWARDGDRPHLSRRWNSRPGGGRRRARWRVSCGLQRVELAAGPLGVVALRELADDALEVEPGLGLA